ncbi:helix-turn-helix domain-containing protein [Aureimonas jatrophae]|uniref:Helix-turn-helix domain-containing protein n=1 Tax=Aureimonas jatrophae TaxID=1166073 RepID=A0A1H0CMW0_9HYPH|nr:helix-turn-helix transcriptional regulator [Aureimonas jatrophae]MBB3949305.1 antitoxin component HigA of HigAB toxin-antitoxin module [Aureimonas jatrophae]SDN59226.1 Helix-turn-helix domain-containing protein [Aureimonas jatrophae]
MNKQVIVSPTGERLVVIAEADFDALVEAADDRSDREAVVDYQRRLAAGETEFVPAAMVDRILAGESALRVWREHRGLSVSALAEAAGLSQPFVSQIESGRRVAGRDSLARLAAALGVDADDLE